MTPKISLAPLLLVSLLLGVCFGTIRDPNFWTTKKLSNGRKAYYSANCYVDNAQVKFIRSTSDPSLTNCIDGCNTFGAKFFSSTEWLCRCYQYGKTVARFPFKDVTDSTYYCGEMR